MQEMNYDIDKSDLIKPYKDEDAITAIINAYLNANGNLFTIVFKNNKEQFNKENLTFKDTVQGVLQIKAVSLSASNDGTELKDFSISMLVPLNENNDIYNEAINTLVKNVNNQQFEVGDSINVTFIDMQIIDANKLAKPLNGVEYELIIVNGKAVTSKQYLQATEQFVNIDGTKLEGVINVSYTSLKTCDSKVLGLSSLIQKNEINGIQIAIDIDLQIYKDDVLHYKLLQEAESKKVYSLEYYNGLFSKNYNMMLLQATITGITGDTVKGRLSFVVGE